MRVTIDLDVPRWARWVAPAIGGGLVLLICVSRVLADPVSLKTEFRDGELLSAADLSSNFLKIQNAQNSHDARLATLETGRVSVQGSSGKPMKVCRGSTPIGNTNWRSYGTDGITVTVSMASCGFTKKPMVLPVLAGGSNHWTTTGGSTPYSPSANGKDTEVFDIYIHSNGAITPQFANDADWHIEWLAFSD